MITPYFVLSRELAFVDSCWELFHDGPPHLFVRQFCRVLSPRAFDRFLSRRGIFSPQATRIVLLFLTSFLSNRLWDMEGLLFILAHDISCLTSSAADVCIPLSEEG